MGFVIRHPPPKTNPRRSLPVVLAPKAPPPLGPGSRCTATRIWIEENWSKFDGENAGLSQTQLHNKMMKFWRYGVSEEEKERYKKKEKEIREKTIADRRERKRFWRKIRDAHEVWQKENLESVQKENPRLSKEQQLKISEERWKGMSHEEKMVYVKMKIELQHPAEFSASLIEYSTSQPFTPEASTSESGSESSTTQNSHCQNRSQRSQDFPHLTALPVEALKRPHGTFEAPSSRFLDQWSLQDSDLSTKGIHDQNNRGSSNSDAVLEQVAMKDLGMSEHDFQAPQHVNFSPDHLYYPGPSSHDHYAPVFTNLDSNFKGDSQQYPVTGSNPPNTFTFDDFSYQYLDYNTNF